MGPANGGQGGADVSLAALMAAAIAHALREEQAFLRTFVAGQKYVAVRGRDPAVLI
jgi:hypothetical protein